MNYELAKKLKDAGFPQKYVCYGMAYSDTTHFGLLKADDEWKENYVLIPTLSELIEACEGRYPNMVIVKGSLGWNAGVGSGITDGVAIEDNCSTPEEAVANLWLELNSKVTPPETSPLREKK